MGLRHKSNAGRIFQVVSIVQLMIHLGAYLAAFIKLIMIDAGGYYDTGVITFIGMTAGSMPLFAIGWWLFQRSFKLSSSTRLWGYLFNSIGLIWSMMMVKVSYFV